MNINRRQTEYTRRGCIHFSSDEACDKKPHKSAGTILPAVSARLFHKKDRENAQHDVLNGAMKV